MGTYYSNHNYGPEAAAFGGRVQTELSPARLAANRANAQKSTGPRTGQGKARSSRNAFRHGVTGQVSVNTDEDRAAHETFTREIIDGLKPDGVIERQLAINIAEQYWRIHRTHALEENMFALGSYGPAADIDVDHPELHTALTSAQVFLDRSRDFERLTRMNSASTGSSNGTAPGSNSYRPNAMLRAKQLSKKLPKSRRSLSSMKRSPRKRQRSLGSNFRPVKLNSEWPAIAP